jgi:Xaa-Pro aminopeptidase
VHEDPYIVAGNGLALEAGMVFSVEPGVYLPGTGGVRIEDVVALSSDGAEILTETSRALTTL